MPTCFKNLTTKNFLASLVTAVYFVILAQLQMESTTIAETARLRVCTFEFWDNGIVYMKLDDNVEVQLEDSKAQFELLLGRFDENRRFRILVDPGRYTSVSNEAREYSSLPETTRITAATAVIVKSLAHRIVMNFLIGFIRRQSMKLRMFDSREKAIQWLLSIKD